MTTYKEFQQQHKQELDDQFHTKYPRGQFVLQKYHSRVYSKTIYGMHWNPRRRTSRSSPRGVSISCVGGSIIESKWQNNSWGKCNYYKDLDTAIKNAENLGFPKKVITIFKKKYAEWSK